MTPAGYLAALLLGLGVHTASSAGFAEGAAAYGRHDDARALRELAPLAAHGNPQAEHVLGLMYYTGRGVARDDAQAFGWLHKAAVQGVPAAQYVVGAMFYLGQAVPRDPARAVCWFRQAAESGHPDAQYALGLMIRYHAGAADDPVLAYALWDLAAARGHRKADGQRASLAHRMTAAQVAQAQALARGWRPGMPLPVRPAVDAVPPH